MEAANELDRLAVKYGTDKFNAHFYTPHYHRHFKDLVSEDFDLLEIGIGGYTDVNGGGHSLRMWKDYFPHARIHGLDFYDKSGVDEDRITTHKGSQSDPVVIAKLLQALPKPEMKIMIDDGSHRPELTITSFMMLFQYLSNGGWYVVEDTETDHYPQYGGDIAEGANQFSVLAFFTKLATNLNWAQRYALRDTEYSPSEFETSIRGITFYKNMIFIEKGPNF